jgi:DNA primase
MLKDKFIDRLIIPVFDKNGSVVGFTGRTLPGDKLERPKYLNSSESQWFKKGNLWYGLHLSKQTIRETNSVIIVEGNMDVITAHKFGLNNVIASQGTSVTSNQIKQLKALTQNIYLAFDNDKAGKLNSKKLFQLAISFNFNVYKVIIPDEFKDLDEYLNNSFLLGDQKPELETKPFLEYLIQKEYFQLTSDNLQEQKKSVSELCSLIAVMDELSIEQYTKKLSQVSKIGQTTLLNLVNNIKGQKTKINDTSPDLDTQTDLKQTEFNRQESTKEQQNLVIWQRLMALFLMKKLNQEYILKIEFLFELLKKLIFSLSEYESLEDYISQNQDVLDLVKIEPGMQTNQIYQHNLWQSLIFYVDQNLSHLLLYSHTKKFYNKLKSR